MIRQKHKSLSRTIKIEEEVEKKANYQNQLAWRQIVSRKKHALNVSYQFKLIFKKIVQ